MEFSEVVRRRRMVRRYSGRPLSPEVIERVLTSALRAPSAGFSQGWAFLALTDAADRASFWPFVPTRVEQPPTMQDAPLVIVPLAHKPPTSIGTRTPTSPGRTGPRRTGRPPTGTSTPAWPRCLCCSPPSTKGLAPASSG
jgi:nitroreductase